MQKFFLAIKPLLLILVPFLLSLEQGNAQTKDTFWSYTGNAILNFSQTSQTNWQGGGQNSVAVSALIHGSTKYETLHRLWENFLDANYGTTRQGDKSALFIKSADELKLLSKYSFRLSKDFLLVSLADFRTTMAPGYSYKKDSSGETKKSALLSKFMAPGYLIVAEGIEYRPSENFFITLAPVSGRFTFVFDKMLSDSGMYGVKKGEEVRAQFGANLEMFFKVKFEKNIEFQSRFSLFAGYHDLSREVVTWDTQLLLKINKLLTTTVITNLIYDPDVKIHRTDNTIGPATQFKEVLALGLQYKLK